MTIREGSQCVFSTLDQSLLLIVYIMLYLTLHNPSQRWHQMRLVVTRRIPNCLQKEEYFVTPLELGPAIEQHDLKR